MPETTHYSTPEPDAVWDSQNPAYPVSKTWKSACGWDMGSSRCFDTREALMPRSCTSRKADVTCKTCLRTKLFRDGPDVDPVRPTTTVWEAFGRAVSAGPGPNPLLAGYNDRDDPDFPH